MSERGQPSGLYHCADFDLLGDFIDGFVFDDFRIHCSYCISQQPSMEGIKFFTQCLVQCP